MKFRTGASHLPREMPARTLVSKKTSTRQSVWELIDHFKQVFVKRILSKNKGVILLRTCTTCKARRPNSQTSWWYVCKHELVVHMVSGICFIGHYIITTWGTDCSISLNQRWRPNKKLHCGWFKLLKRRWTRQQCSSRG